MIDIYTRIPTDSEDTDWRFSFEWEGFDDKILTPWYAASRMTDRESLLYTLRKMRHLKDYRVHADMLERSWVYLITTMADVTAYDVIRQVRKILKVRPSSIVVASYESATVLNNVRALDGLTLNTPPRGSIPLVVIQSKSGAAINTTRKVFNL